MYMWGFGIIYKIIRNQNVFLSVRGSTLDVRIWRLRTSDSKSDVWSRSPHHWKSKILTLVSMVYTKIFPPLNKNSSAVWGLIKENFAESAKHPYPSRWYDHGKYGCHNLLQMYGFCKWVNVLSERRIWILLELFLTAKCVSLIMLLPYLTLTLKCYTSQ